MKNWKQILGITGTTLSLVLILIPFSLIIGWNLLSAVIFWFLIVPLITIAFPYLIQANKQHQMQSIIGIIFFYGAIVLMIYMQSATDFFKVMAVSGVVNLVLILGIYRLKKQYIFKKKQQPEIL